MTGIQQFKASPTATAAADPWLGCIVGDRYRIEEQIGKGGMGVVYRARHLELGKRVAIKRLDPQIAGDPISFERFRREAIAASRIESPHVVHVFDWGKAPDGSPYLVMELLEGSDLRAYFISEGRLLPEAAAAVIGQLLRGLSRTHQAGIVHRDLKPENIFLCRYDSEAPYVKLLDFGISKTTNASAEPDNVTRRGSILGTASYMSPEQARGDLELDERSDLFSVGAILFEALSGRVPHHARSYEGTLVDICTRDADDVRLHAPLVPEAVAQVVARALERDVSRRFQTAKEFLEALTAAVPDLGSRLAEHVTGPAVAQLGLDRRGQKRRKFWAVTTLLLIAGAVLWALLEARHQQFTKIRGTAPAPSSFPNSTTATTAAETNGSRTLATASIGVAAPAPGKVNVSSTASPPGTSRGSVSRPSPAAPNAAATGPTDHAGVASELKLRRTMP